jgi:hypothetical protein
MMPKATNAISASGIFVRAVSSALMNGPARHGSILARVDLPNAYRSYQAVGLSGW